MANDHDFFHFFFLAKFVVCCMKLKLNDHMMSEQQIEDESNQRTNPVQKRSDRQKV